MVCWCATEQKWAVCSVEGCLHALVCRPWCANLPLPSISFFFLEMISVFIIDRILVIIDRKKEADFLSPSLVFGWLGKAPKNGLYHETDQDLIQFPNDMI